METNKILNKFVRIAMSTFLLLGFLLCSGCMTYIGKDGPYYGRIVDKETRQPLEGVVVVGNWGIASWGGGTSYYDTYETVTDRGGNFTIPGQGIQIFSDLTRLQLFILKAGYEDIPGYKWNTDGLPLFWEDKTMVIGLKKLPIEQLYDRSLHYPSGPKGKYKLFIRERNAEKRALGKPESSMIPEE